MTVVVPLIVTVGVNVEVLIVRSWSETVTAAKLVVAVFVAGLIVAVPLAPVVPDTFIVDRL